MTARERAVVELMKQGYRLLPIRHSRMFGLFCPPDFKNVAARIRIGTVGSLHLAGHIAVGQVGCTSEYVLASKQ